MILKKGVTGFRHITDEPLPNVAMSDFKTACYNAARHVNGQMISHTQADVGNNFHTAVIQNNYQQTKVVCNAIFPIIALCTPESIEPLHFVDVPPLATAFIQAGAFNVVSKMELNEPVTAAMLTQLSPVEREQIRGWRPKTVGQIIFNYWD